MGLLTRLESDILIGDGALGSLVYASGIDRAFEELNLINPEKVQGIHEAYIEAGADVIQTNSYGANYIKLARFGLEDQVSRLNKEAVKIARKASRKSDVFVLGNLGGINGAHAQLATKEEVKRSFREQLFALLSEGVDGLILETYYDFEELRAVLDIARTETDLPIITNVSMHEPGVLENGLALDKALTELANRGADVTGINCQLGPAQMLTALEGVPLNKDSYLAVYPNASIPAYRDGVLYYENVPDYFKSSAKAFRDQGVRLIGGCCGTTPEHIHALKEGVKGLVPLKEKEVIQLTSPKIKKRPSRKGLADKARHERTIICELDAPKHLDIEAFLKGAKALKEAGVDAITLADNSLATPRISNLAIAALLKQKLNINPLVHLTCRDRNLIGLQAHLLGLHTLGVKEILAITGDPTKIGDFPGATSVFDVNSFKLIELIQKGNTGISFSGKSLREETDFSVACALNPNVLHLDKAVKRLEKKIESGANYCLTQPVYSVEKIKELKEATKHLDIPIFIGIMPLTSTKNAEFLHNEVPGITLTDEVREKMRAAKTRSQATEVSLDISKELIDKACKHFNGIYLITPFMRYDLSVELIKYIEVIDYKEEFIHVKN